MRIVYLKSGHRQPVQEAAPIYLRDIQQDIPRGWCPSCGQMLYSPEARLCRRCEEGEGHGEESEPLPELYTDCQSC